MKCSMARLPGTAKLKVNLSIRWPKFLSNLDPASTYLKTWKNSSKNALKSMKPRGWVWNSWEIGQKVHPILALTQWLKSMSLLLIRDTALMKTSLNFPRRPLKLNPMLLSRWVTLLIDNQLELKKPDPFQTSSLRWITNVLPWTRKTSTLSKILNLWAKLLLIRTILWSWSRLTNLDLCSRSMKSSKK